MSDETFRTKVHKITLLIVDHDEVGAEEIKNVIEDARYPNRCISPHVMATETVEIDYSDEHPINNYDRMAAEFERLFKNEAS